MPDSVLEILKCSISRAQEILEVFRKLMAVKSFISKELAYRGCVFQERYGSGGHEDLRRIRTGLNSEEMLADLHVSSDCINNTTSPITLYGKKCTCSTIYIIFSADLTSICKF
jgi:hypothetical protein